MEEGDNTLQPCAGKGKTKKRINLEHIKVGLLAIIAICLIILVFQNFYPTSRGVYGSVYVNGGNLGVYGSVDVDNTVHVRGSVDVDNIVEVWVDGGHVSTSTW